MSITISTIAAEARARSSRPVEVRFRAVSSALSSFWPEAASAFARCAGFSYSAKERTSADRRDHPEDDRGDHPAVPDLEGVAQDRKPDPEANRTHEPEDGRGGSDNRDPVQAERQARSVGREQRDDDDPGHHERTHERRGAEQVKREDPVLEVHPLGAICSTT